MMAMAHFDRVVVALHHSGPPTDEEWARWIVLCQRASHREPRGFVETHGGGPNAKQRKELADALQGQNIRTAVFTDSVVVRGIVTAIAWLGVSLRAFPLGHYPAAGNYLELTSDELERAMLELHQLREQIGMRDPDQLSA